MRRIVPAAMLAALLAGTLAGHAAAQSQLATTDLVPAAPGVVHPNLTAGNRGTLMPDNPAALAWGAPSRVAGGRLEGSDKDAAAGTRADHEGSLLGFRFVSHRVAVAAQQQVLREDPGTGIRLEQTQGVQASLGLFDVVGLGVGYEHVVGRTSAAGSDVKRQQLGVSVRLKDRYYLGMVIDRDALEDSTQPGQSFNRTATAYGAAVRSGGPVSWYLAYDALDAPSFDTATPQGGVRSSTLSGQVLWGAVLLGYAYGTGTLDNAVGTADDATSQTWDVGWAPIQGLTYTVRLQTVHLKDTGATPPATDQTVRTASANLAWQF